MLDNATQLNRFLRTRRCRVPTRKAKRRTNHKSTVTPESIAKATATLRAYWDDILGRSPASRCKGLAHLDRVAPSAPLPRTFEQSLARARDRKRYVERGDKWLRSV